MPLILEAGRAEKNYWRDLRRYRELFQVLAWRDLSVRYKQTVIGVAWALLRPFLTLVIFTLVFGKIAGLPSEGTAPYALLVFAGMLPWIFFSTALGEARSAGGEERRRRVEGRGSAGGASRGERGAGGASSGTREAGSWNEVKAIGGRGARGEGRRG